MKHRIIDILKNLTVFIILFFSYAIAISMNWVYKTFGNIGLEEILFQINVPSTNANTDYYFDYAKNALFYIILLTFVTFFILFFIFRKKQKKSYPRRMTEINSENSKALVIYKGHKIDKHYLGKITVSILALIISIVYTVNKTELATYIEHIMEDSSFIKDEYVNPKYTNIIFPSEKRNLIYIYLESMEATFYSENFGGAFEEGLIDGLEELANENIVFSTSKANRGLYSLPGSTWTTGAMTAQTMGLPLKIPIEQNSYGEYTSYLPGAIGLGNILKQHGYNQMLAIGSYASFGGRDHLFKQHGNYEIFDFAEIVKEEKKKEEDFIWWGVPDADLYEYAKEKISIMSQQKKPFNFTMLTVDTHATNGFICGICEENFEEQYYNVINCASKQVVDFVHWIQEQDFYENTTIVICGDHPSMQPDTFDYLRDQGYERTVLNIIINPAVMPENSTIKNGSTMDMFPTTLASLGVKIDGDRLGLGTNLFSDQETIIDKYGYKYVKDELEKSSSYYNKEFVYGD